MILKIILRNNTFLCHGTFLSKKKTLRCKVSHVTCHMSPVANANSHSNRPVLLIPQLCTSLV